MRDCLIKKIRSFNRYYTVWLEVMNKDYLGTELAWPESRVLFEVYLCPNITATDLCEHLKMDKGYVSRIIRKFEKDGFLTRRLVVGSKGLKTIVLTTRGENEALKIDMHGTQQIQDKLKYLDQETFEKLCEAMSFIEETLRDNDKGEKLSWKTML